jgi:hypothetical protein
MPWGTAGIFRGLSSLSLQKIEQAYESLQLYRGLIVRDQGVKGSVRGVSVERGFLHLEGKATVKLEAF